MKYLGLTLAILGFALSIYGQPVAHPWTEAENERIKQMWIDGILDDDNFQQFLEAIKKEAHHPDRIDRALRRTESRSIFAMSGPGFGESPLQTISVLLLTIVFILLIVVQKKAMIGIAAICWLVGLVINAATFAEYIVGSVIVIPIACLLRWVVGRARA